MNFSIEKNERPTQHLKVELDILGVDLQRLVNDLLGLFSVVEVKPQEPCVLKTHPKKYRVAHRKRVVLLV